MDKTEMIRIDDAIISNENKLQYLEFHETIFNTIKETYCYIFYIEGMKEFFGSPYQCKRFSFELFFKDILLILKQKICMNIWKLLFDKGNNALSIYQMKKFVVNNFKVQINRKNIKVPTMLEKNITGIRNVYLSHNLSSETCYTVNALGLKPLLDEIYAYFRNLWIGNFVDEHLFVSDDYFEFLEPVYKNSVKDAFKGIQLK